MAGLSDRELDFIAANPSAAMITIADGVAKPARVSLAMFAGALLSSGTGDRVRTLRLRDDPRCTLFVFGGEWQWLGLETTVAIREDEEAIAAHVPFMRQLQHRPTGPLSWFDGDLEEPAFIERMRAEQRLLYEFAVQRTYGLF